MTATPATPVEAPLSVLQLTQKIKAALRAGVPARVVVRAELSGFRPNHSSGHAYFTLKDPQACINCVMFAEQFSRVKFKLADGMDLLAAGRIDVYPQQGKYQFYIDTLSPMGQGALELAFQQMRLKLEREGLFAPARKKPLPAYPMRLVLVTSRTAAALHDILKVLRRYPWLHLSLYHVAVQGSGSGAQIARALAHLSQCHIAGRQFDVILLARGGGSLEDLWSFNEEVVARAIAGSVIPIITGIGHEVDVSIADLVADHHAHTPTEAAQTAIGQWRQVTALLGQADTRLRRSLRNTVADSRQRLDAIRRHETFRRPLDRVRALQQQIDDRQRGLSQAMSIKLNSRLDRLRVLEARWTQQHPRTAISALGQKLGSFENAMQRLMRHQLEMKSQRVNALHTHLQAISPDQVLRRGFTITTDRRGNILRDASALKPGERLMTRFGNGVVESIVEDPSQPKLF